MYIIRTNKKKIPELVTSHIRNKKGPLSYHFAAMQDVVRSNQEATQSSETDVKKRCHICHSKISRTSKQCCDKLKCLQ